MLNLLKNIYMAIVGIGGLIIVTLLMMLFPRKYDEPERPDARC